MTGHFPLIPPQTAHESLGGNLIYIAQSWPPHPHDSLLTHVAGPDLIVYLLPRTQHIVYL